MIATAVDVPGNRPELRVVREGDPAPPAEQPRDELALLQRGFRDYWRYAARVATRILGPDDDEVDDVLQEVFLEALRGLKTLHDPRALRGWIATITVRKVSRRLRGRKLKRRFLPLEGPALELESSQLRPEDAAMVRSAYARLERLPVGQRVAWPLHHLEQETYDEIARICGCASRTAKRRVAGAQAFLREEPAGQGGGHG